MNIRNNILIIGKKVRKYKKHFRNNSVNKVFYYPYELENKNIEKLKFLSIKKSIKEIILFNYFINDNDFLSFCNWAQINDICLKIIPNENQLNRGKIILDDTLGIPVILYVSNPINISNYADNFISIFYNNCNINQIRKQRAYYL